MLLFQPDIFTNPIPAFSHATSVSENVVHEVLCHYSNSVGKVTDVWQIGGIAVEKSASVQANASNFRLSTSEGEFLLKRNLRPDLVASLDKQLALQEWLKDRGVAIPQLVLTDSGARHSDFQNEMWYLARFVPGNYFSGQDREIEAAGNEIGRLLATLLDRPAELSLGRTRADYFTPLEHQTVAKTSDLRKNWNKVFGTDNATALEAGWAKAIDLFNALSYETEFLNRFPRVTAHIDLHPHNILMGHNALNAILDFDACYEIPLELSVGFATCKLMKRVGTRLQGNSRLDETGRWTDRFLVAMEQHLPMISGSRKTMELFAKAEVMRRLLSMCNRHISGQKTVWNDIPVHLSGLFEIDKIFQN
jgi:hypothetical protein